MKWRVIFAAFWAANMACADAVELYVCSGLNGAIAARLTRSTATQRLDFAVDTPWLFFKAESPRVILKEVGYRMVTQAVVSESVDAPFAQIIFDGAKDEVGTMSARMMIGYEEKTKAFDLECISIVAEQ